VEKLKIGLTYDDVLLTPGYSEIPSRKSVSLETHFGVRSYGLPIISSPMSTVTEGDMCNIMDSFGGMGIVHRYNTIQEQVEICKSIPDTCGAAIGICGDYLDRAKSLCQNAGVKIICIDVAHAHHSKTKEAITNLKRELPEDVLLIVGNVATKGGFEDLVSWGADGVKVGIGPSGVCETRSETGHGYPQLSAIFECNSANNRKEAILIADGGIKTTGDMVKALAAGADFVMLGSLLAASKEAPGDVFYDEDLGEVKKYSGMASEEAQNDFRGHTNSLEGVSSQIPYKGSLLPILDRYIHSIRTGLSYSGAKNLEELRVKTKFVQQTSAGQFESSTHIKKIGKIR